MGKKEKLIHINDTKKYRHNLIPIDLKEKLLMGTTSIQYDSMGYPLRLFIDRNFKGHWIDIPVSDIREEDVVVILEFR